MSRHNTLHSPEIVQLLSKGRLTVKPGAVEGGQDSLAGGAEEQQEESFHTASHHRLLNGWMVRQVKTLSELVWKQGSLMGHHQGILLD